MLEEPFEIFGKRHIVEQQAGVAIGRGAHVGKVVASKQDACAVDDDALCVATKLNFDSLRVQAKITQVFMHFPRIPGCLLHNAEDEANVAPAALLITHRIPEFNIAIVGLARRRCKTLVLYKQRMLRVLHNWQHSIEIIVGRKDGLDLENAVLIERSEIGKGALCLPRFGADAGKVVEVGQRFRKLLRSRAAISVEVAADRQLVGGRKAVMLDDRVPFAVFTFDEPAKLGIVPVGIRIGLA